MPDSMQQTRREDRSPDSETTSYSMDPGSPDGTGNSRARQRLKPWLEAQINSERFPGLMWVDKEKGIFRITWKHGGRADWSEQDALIFREWAIHTGRYREGTDNPDWPSWKTRLRCALNKLPDIQELKDLSCYDEPNPYRVYKFVDRRGCCSPPHRPPPQPVTEDSCGFSPSPPLYQPPHRPSVIQQPNIPTIVNESLDTAASAHRQEGVAGCGDAQVSSLGSDLEQVSITDLLPMNNISLTNISVDSNIHSEPMDTDSLKGGACQQLSQHIKPEPVDSVDPVYYPTPVSDQEFTLTLRYRRQVIKHKTISNPHGCRVYYGDLSKHMSIWNPQLFGEMQADQVLVPYQPGQLEVRQDQLTYPLLNALELGVNIYMHKGSIYVLRRSKTTVFTSPPNRPDRLTFKVERRNEPVKIFDFNNDFLPAFLKFQRGEGPRPSPQVIVAMGQNFHNEADPYLNLLLSVTVAHPHACRLMAQHVPESSGMDLPRSEEYGSFYGSCLQPTHGAATPLTVNQPLAAYATSSPQ